MFGSHPIVNWPAFIYDMSDNNTIMVNGSDSYALALGV